MGQTVRSQYLMTSRRIVEVIDRVIDELGVRDEREFAVVAAIKLGRLEYRHSTLVELAGKLGELDHAARIKLARDIHPLLCSLTVEEHRGKAGPDGYCIQILNPRGVSGRMVLFDINAREVEAA